MLYDIFMSDLSETGAVSFDIVDQPTKQSLSAAVEDTWDDTESESSQQLSRKVKLLSLWLT